MVAKNDERIVLTEKSDYWVVCTLENRPGQRTTGKVVTRAKSQDILVTGAKIDTIILTGKEPLHNRIIATKEPPNSLLQ